MMRKSSSKKPTPKRLPIFQPQPSLICTKSFYFYVSDFTKTVELFLFTVELASKVDEYAKNAAHALAAIDRGLILAHEKEGIIEELERNRDAALTEIETKGASKRLAEYSIMNIRHLVTTLADSFLTFLSHIIQSALRKSRNTLKSSETIRIDDLLEFWTNRDLTNYLIDRTINELSYGGMRKIEEYIRERFGIEMLKANKSRDLLIMFLELRNIYVHNRGYINDVFLTRIIDPHDFAFTRNERYWATISTLANNCVDVALRLDETIAAKFHLDRKTYANWKKKPPRFV
jgi:hypothetical protein